MAERWRLSGLAPTAYLIASCATAYRRWPVRASNWPRGRSLQVALSFSLALFGLASCNGRRRTIRRRRVVLVTWTAALHFTRMSVHLNSVSCGDHFNLARRSDKIARRPTKWSSYAATFSLVSPQAQLLHEPRGGTRWARTIRESHSPAGKIWARTWVRVASVREGGT